MKNNLATLLEEFLPEDMIGPITTKAKEMNLTLKITKLKGRWHRETLQKLIKVRSNHCQTCNVSGDKEKLTLDHIIPKKILLDMGLEDYYTDESNLQILCARCNGSKASQLDFSHPKTIVLLEKYIAIYKESRGL